MPYTNPLGEHEFQELFLKHLVGDDPAHKLYRERIAKTDYNPVYAMDTELLFEFLESTQKDSMDRIREVYDGGYQATVLNTINNDIASRGLVRCIWTGVDIDGITLDLVEPRPSAAFDKKANGLYADNIMSVMKEVPYKGDDDRIDLGIFLNGLAIFTVELKCQTAGTSWTYRDAIEQYRERDCKNRLLMPRVGALAHFVMDLSEVWVCANLTGKTSAFLPFNKGVRSDGSVHETDTGNPHNDSGPRTSYMWEDILSKETVFDLIYDFVYISVRKNKQGKKVAETAIFPRYQQLRAVRRVADSIKRRGTQANYLIEHSAGSGKTNTISWLAHKLAGLYQDGSDDPLFDKVLVITDRKVVDRQLQDAVYGMAKDPGVVRVLSERTGKGDKLGKALHSNYRIVVSTIQSFYDLDKGTFEGEGKSFAVLIDEAHGSTSGRLMGAVNSTLAGGTDVDSTLDEVTRFLATDAARSGRQPNVTLIGFTATPTGKTLQQFGQLDEHGHKTAFDLYSMNQAIKEGFILDVTSNYVTYDSFCKVVKAIKDDPELESGAAKRQLAHMIATSDGTIRGNLAVMVDHFASVVADELDGTAKAMIVTAGREEAVRYFLAYQEARHQNMPLLGRYQALVAFTGEVTIDGQKYTEAGLNGFSDEKTADTFDTDSYRVLIVADKFQTGFDQPKLCAMYVDKHLSGIMAVQTLSRLNRICKPYDKKTFVLDFKNDYETIHEAFAPFYKDTILDNPLTLSDVRETEAKLLALNVLDPDDVEEFNQLLAKPKPTTKEKGRMYALVDAAADRVKGMSEGQADECRRTIRNFIKQYGFLLQVAPFEDRSIHMEYNFCTSLIRMIDADGSHTPVIDLRDKVRLEEFSVKKSGEHVGEGIDSSPVVRIAKGTGTGLSHDQLHRLSEIIAQWNAKYGTNFDPDIAAGSLMSLKATVEADPKVKRSAKVNTRSDFKNTVDDRTDDALVKNYEQNQEWYGFLLSNSDARKELMHAFVDDIYDSLRSSQGEGAEGE